MLHLFIFVTLSQSRINSDDFEFSKISNDISVWRLNDRAKVFLIFDGFYMAKDDSTLSRILMVLNLTKCSIAYLFEGYILSTENVFFISDKS